MAKCLMIQLQAAPYAGTAYLCGAARAAGHEFALHLFRNDERCLAAVARERPDCVGFSCMSGLHQEAVRVAGEIKRRFDLPVILGGAHPTLFPDIIHEPPVDVICRGEGETAFVDFLDALGQGKPYDTVPNLWVKRDGEVRHNELRPLVEPLDRVPMIDWSCYAGTVVAKSAPIAFPIRGCPYSCSYCFNEAFRTMYRGRGSTIRMFSPERAVREIEAALRVFSRSPVLFSCDTFGTNLPWMEELFEKYEQITDLPFVVLLRPELATERAIEILARHRCYSVAIGVESGSERVRREVLNRRYSNELLLTVAGNLHRHGIRFRTYNMIGLPTETEAEIWETIHLNVAMRTDYPRGAFFTPMPGTKITAIAMEQGYLDPDFSFDSIPATILSHSILKKIDQRRLQNLSCFFQTVIRFPRTEPLVRRLLGLRPNPLFRAWYFLVYLYLHRKSERRGFLPYLAYVFANRKFK